MKILSCLAGAALCLATGANAITYYGTLTAGSSTASYSIDTDGTLGTLTNANILSTSGVVTHGAASASFVNGNFNDILGNAVTATATQIWFDTSANGYLIVGNYGSVFTGICLTAGAGSCAGEQAPVILVAVGYSADYEMVAASGRYLVASTAAVPEPATWGLMIAGFGLTGAALRRRRGFATA